MNYLTNNKVFIEKYKKFLKSVGEDESAFRFFLKQLYITDLMNYTRVVLKGKTIETGFGDYNTKIAILLDDSNEDVLNFIRSIFEHFKIPLYDLYVTPYKKIQNGDNKFFKRISELELDCIAPECILSIGNHMLKVNNCSNIVIVPKKELYSMLKLMKLKKENNLSEEENEKCIKYKKIVWNELSKALKYYKK